MRRRQRAIGMIMMLLAVGLVAFVMASKSARADAPQQTGWWWAGNNGYLPETAGSGIPPAQAPAPPDVTGSQLLVEGGGGNNGNSTAGTQATPACSTGAPPVGGDCAPAAYSALVFELSPGETASTLTLTIASAQGSADATPGTTLQLCALTNPLIQQEYAGPMSDAPGYDCAKSVSAAASSSGASYQFDVSGLVQDGSLAVAILPTQPSDRVVFNPPDSNALTTQQSGSITSGTTGGFDASGVGAGGGGFQTSSGASGGTGSAVAAVPSAPVSGTGVSPALSQLPSAPTTKAPSVGSSAQNLAASSVSAGPAGASAAAVGLVLAAILGGGGLWAYAGSARREPETAA